MQTRWEWLPAVAAPVVVTAGLLAAHSAALVFLAYHFGLCLALPWLVSWRRGRDLPALRGDPAAVGVGLGLAVVGLAAPLLAWRWWPSLLPDAASLGAVLHGWGVDAAAAGPVLVFLAVVNGPAEELFWRGWLPARLRPGRGGRVLLLMLFSSYHTVTVGALAPSPAAAALMLTLVPAAAAFWTWSVRRWRSLWPAVLSHAGATLGYVAVCRWILG
ncbi:MAG: CPBP family intramembrane glutamic endopeptidase [Candidatus Krumholzibacteriia bacterium]